MNEPEIPAAIDAELRVVDEALESGSATSSDSLERELQELTLALRAEAAEPSPEFASELRARVRDGFPRSRRLPRPRFARPKLSRLRRPPKAALAGAASLLLAVAVGVSLQARDEDRDDATPAGDLDAKVTAPGGGEGAKPLTRTRGGAEPAVIAPEPPVGGPGFAPGERRRRIERSASLTLAAPAGDLDRVAEGIVRLTDRYEGFVVRSSLSTGDEGTTGGDFELRIPAERLQAALAELSKLADVRARTQSGQDVTREFASAADRLEAARAERRSLLRRLERAPTDSAAESVRRRLDRNAAEIRGLSAQLRDLRTRTSYAGVTVSLNDGEGDGGASSPGPDDDLGAAADDALDSLTDSIAILLRVLGIAIPLGLVAAVIGLGARALRRRRREAALSG